MIFEIVSRADVGRVHLREMRFDLTGREPFRGERDHHRINTIEPALTLADRQRLERAITITRHIELDRADLGDHRLRPRPIARVAVVAALDGVLRIADVFLHLDFETRLEHLLREIRKQPARPDQAPPVSLGLLHELLRERPIRPLRVRLVRRCRHHHIIAGHVSLSFPPSEPLSVSGQTSYTGNLTVPRVRPDDDWPEREPSDRGA